MKKYSSLLSLFLVLVLCLTPAAYAAGESGEEPFSVEAAAAILIEADTGEVLYELNPDERRFPGSITKVMTGLLTVEAAEGGAFSLDDKVTLGTDLYTGIGYDGSSLKLQTGEELTVRDLLYAALLHSANEACNALAVVVSDSIPTFVELMNQSAGELGMTGTHFCNTHGYPDEDHYTTARDRAKLCREALTHPDLREVVSSATYTIPPTNLHETERVLKNSNALVSNSVQGYRYQYAIGLKTGYTSKAGYCLASAAQKDHRTVIAILLGGKYWIENDQEVPHNYFVESRRLLEHGFNSFSRKTILDKIEPIATIRVELCDSQDYVTVQPAESLSAILPNDLDPALFQRDVVLPTEPLQAPIEKGTVLGTITLSHAGTTYGTVDLVASTSLERSQFLYVLERIRWVFSHLWVRLILLAVVILILVFALRRMIYGPSRRRRRRDRERAYSSSYRGRGR